MTDDSPSTSLGLLEYALVFAFGALVAGFATLTAWTNAYMGANPDTGSVSGGSGLILVLFMAGVVAMFVAAGRALEAILQKHA